VKVSLSHIKQDVRSLISDGKVKDAIGVLKLHSNNFRSNFVKDIQLLSCRYNLFLQAKRRGLINDNTELMRIASDVLELLGLVKKNAKKMQKKC